MATSQSYRVPLTKLSNCSYTLAIIRALGLAVPLDLLAPRRGDLLPGAYEIQCSSTWRLSGLDRQWPAHGKIDAVVDPEVGFGKEGC
jgi:hypothetical protein